MIDLRLTCGACPEQYDAYLGDERVGYLRLRHGHFTVSCPGPDGCEVYSAGPQGDGIFESDERRGYLGTAVKKIEAWVKAGRPIDMDEPLSGIEFTIDGESA